MALLINSWKIAETIISGFLVGRFNSVNSDIYTLWKGIEVITLKIRNIYGAVIRKSIFLNLKNQVKNPVISLSAQYEVKQYYWRVQLILSLGYSQRMRLQTWLYEIYTVWLLISIIPCNCKIVAFFFESINPFKSYIQGRRLSLTLES